MTTSERAIWFGSTERPLFGWLGLPELGSRGAVVLCPPIGADCRAAHRAYRALAAGLSAAGFATLRFDYDGTGDSAGAWDDPDRLSAWTASVVAAVELVRECGAGSVAAVGMRLGSAVLARASLEHGLALAAAVWWDPVVRGRTFLREQQLLLASFETDVAPRTDGAVETSGYLFDPETVAQLRALNVDAGSALGCADRLLILSRPDRPAPTDLAKGLDGVAGVAWGHALGQDRLLDVWPDLAVVPEQSVARIVGWLDDVMASQPQPLPMQVRGRDEAVLVDERSGLTVRERAVRLGPIDLFGIMTGPDGETATDLAGPWLVFLNCSTETRIGPARQWVELSRYWARVGAVRSLRVDLSGLGDSPTHPGQQEYLGYAPDFLQDVHDVAAAIAPDDPRQVVFVGLCSGAYLALEAALDFGPRGVCVINPILDHDTALRPQVSDARRKAFRPMWRWLYRLAIEHKRVAEGIWRVYRQLVVRHSPMHVLAEAVGNGTDVLAIFSDSDVRPFRDVLYWRARGEPALRRSGRLQLSVLAGIDHQLYLARGRRMVADTLSAYVLSRYARPGPQHVEREQ